MNAYELADKLQELDSKLHLIDLFKSANMLRQQADRIAELEKSAEPVGWFEQDENMKSVWYQCDKDDPSAVPLYTTPQTKPLSDGEIIKLTPWDKNPYELYTEMEFEDLIKFARAIEERHGIK